MTFADSRSPTAFDTAIQPNTKLLFGEVLGNPGLEVLDVEKVADVAHSSGLPLLVDSTLTTPYLIRPCEHGADLIVHAATEFLSGHGIVVGGLLVDGGLFDWEAGHRHPTLTKSYEGFHGLVFAEEFGPLAFLTRAREEGMHDFGACMAPTTAFYILQGLETLSIRMEKHVANTRKILDCLVGHDSVLSVTYPELDSHPNFELAKRLLPWGAGSILSLHIKGARSAGQKFIEAMNLFSHLTSVGDAKSLAIHPASTTLHRMDKSDLEQAGIDCGLIRLSIGLEDVDDLIEDLSRALRASQTL